MSERYEFTPRDAELLWSATLLLRKVMGSGKISPAQMVSLAKLQHIFSILPRASENVTASVSVSSPKRRFGDIVTYHWWDFEADGSSLTIESGGHFYDPKTGGDTFTTMSLSAKPGKPTTLDDHREALWMVPDVQSFSEGVDAIDFASGDFAIVIEDSDNPLLEESLEDDEEEDDNGQDANGVRASEDETSAPYVEFGNTEDIELYRRGDKFDINRQDWNMALLIFREMGFKRGSDVQRFIRPLAFVKADEGVKMKKAGELLFGLIKKEPLLATQIKMDCGLLFELINFVGEGAFIVGKYGSYENAIADDSWPDAL